MFQFKSLRYNDLNWNSSGTSKNLTEFLEVPYKNFYDELRGKFEHKEKLNRLYTLRNQIAHGGSTFRLGGVPQAVNTEHIFKSAEKRVVEFFRFVDKMRENAALS